jgi:hypothetical protein
MGSGLAERPADPLIRYAQGNPLTDSPRGISFTSLTDLAPRLKDTSETAVCLYNASCAILFQRGHHEGHEGGHKEHKDSSCSL